MEKLTFMTACSRFFGRLSNQNLSEFSAEVKTLTAEDRAYFKREFAKVGIEIVEAA